MDDFHFCGHVCLAASRMQIYLRWNADNSLYEFIDKFSGSLISGERNEDRKAALRSACDALVEYFTK